MSDIRDLRIRRAHLLEECKVILDKVKDENRDFNSAERRNYDAKWSEITQLGFAIAAQEPESGFPKREHYSNDRDFIGAILNYLEQPVGDGQRPEVGSSRSVKPSEVRVYRPNESIASVFEYRDLPRDVRADDLDMGRWLRGVVTGSWTGAEAERRTMSTGDSVLGGYMVPSPLSARLVDLARNQSVLLRAGAGTVPMTSSELTMARVTGDPTAYWKPENVEATESDMELGALVFRAHTLMAICRMSVELFEDAQGIGQTVENAMAQAVGLELDRAGMFGIGAAEEPRGIFYDPDLSVLDLGVNGDYLVMDDFIDALGECWDVNGTPSAVIYSPRTKKTIAKLKDGNGLYMEMPKDVRDLRHLSSNQIPNDLTHGAANNASVAFVGGFGNLILGARNEMRIEVSREADSAFKKHQVLVKIWLRGDWNTTRPAEICRIVGIIP